MTRRLEPRPQGRLRWRQWLRRTAHPARLGTLRRTAPLSQEWGHDRGTPVDRYYIERFLDERRADIGGHVLEVQDSNYTDRFGVNVTQRDVLDIDSQNRRATFIADLARAKGLPSEAFDCFIVTQTLQLIYDPSAAAAEIHRILRPGGVLLATLPGLCRIERAYFETDYWRFTPASCQRLLAEEFGPERVKVHAYGNVLAAIAFLTGMASEELTRRELEAFDPLYPVIVGVRAVKSAGSEGQ